MTRFQDAVATNHAAAQQLSDELRGERIHLVAGDLTDPEHTRRVWRQAVEVAGR